MWNLKYGKDDPIHKTETEHCRGEQTRGSQGSWGSERVGWMRRLLFWTHTVSYTWNGWAVGPAVQHRELGVIGSLCCTTETEETLQINYNFLKSGQKSLIGHFSRKDIQVINKH